MKWSLSRIYLFLIGMKYRWEIGKFNLCNNKNYWTEVYCELFTITVILRSLNNHSVYLEKRKFVRIKLLFERFRYLIVLRQSKRCKCFCLIQKEVEHRIAEDKPSRWWYFILLISLPFSRYECRILEWTSDDNISFMIENLFMSTIGCLC